MKIHSFILKLKDVFINFISKMSKIFRKDVSMRSEELIRKEVKLQSRASKLGLSPKL